MFTTPEQFAEASKANLETMFTLGQKAFEGVEKLVELNLSVAKASMEESAEKARELLSVKDAQELLAFGSNVAQPAAEKAVSYSKHVYEIATATTAEVAKIVEAQIADSNKKLVSAIDAATKNAPAGSETAVSILKSALSAANSAYDSVNKAAKQVAEMAEQNIAAATASVTKATTASRAKKAA